MKFLSPALLILSALIMSGCSSSQELKPSASETTSRQELILSDKNMNKILNLTDPKQKITLAQLHKIIGERSLFLSARESSFGVIRSQVTNLKFTGEPLDDANNRMLIIDRKNREIYCSTRHPEDGIDKDVILFTVADNFEP